MVTSAISSNKEFEKYILQNERILYYKALKFTKNPDDAKDLVQETIVKALRGRNSFEMGTNCTGWLIRILINTFINNYRKNQIYDQKLKKFQYKLQQEEDEINSIIKCEEDIIKKESTDEILDLINQHVPPVFKEVLILVDIKNLSQTEVSENFNIPRGTVMSKLFRGRNILRQKLGLITSKASK